MNPPKEERRSKSPRLQWKSDTYLGLRPSEIDWARLAAFIDGEGSINLSPRRTNTGGTITLCAKIVIANTDFRLAHWLSQTFGMTYRCDPARVNHDRWKPCFWATACGYRACWIARNAMPWFLLKAAQAEVLLTHQETMGSFERGSGVKTPDNVLEFRNELRQKLHELNRRGPKVAAIAEVS
jgi:hypothetical protein